jgi:hypothetical protein
MQCGGVFHRSLKHFRACVEKRNLAIISLRDEIWFMALCEGGNCGEMYKKIISLYAKLIFNLFFIVAVTVI